DSRAISVPATDPNNRNGPPKKPTGRHERSRLATPQPETGVTARPVPDRPSLAPPAGTVVRLVHCKYSSKVGASMAWDFARPGLQYAFMEDLRRGVPTKESRATPEALVDLRNEHRSACLSAFLACEDPETRQDLALELSLDPADYPAELRTSHEKARLIIWADPERYHRLLERCTHMSPPA
ncbi:hypothetical protein ACH4M4_36205, partial [Streptomyces sp. NPDC017254]|uniref:hypothetical protein n=1 Tax=unclassified Streptomyces TaxID=2593676 RepID=UPI0037B830BC